RHDVAEQRVDLLGRADRRPHRVLEQLLERAHDLTHRKGVTDAAREREKAGALGPDVQHAVAGGTRDAADEVARGRGEIGRQRVHAPERSKKRAREVPVRSPSTRTTMTSKKAPGGP